MSPGNCLDLTNTLVNTQPVGVDLCVRAGENASITLECNIVEGSPAPNIEWLKDGVTITNHSTIKRVNNDRLVIHLPKYADRPQKRKFEGNYTCHAFNIAGSTRMETHITLFGGMYIQCKLSVFVIQCLLS